MTRAADMREDWVALRDRYERLLVARLEIDPPLDEVAKYALAGGKRVRPMLVEHVGRVVRAPAAALTEVAIAVEYLHTASLLLDDLRCMDDAAQRRNAPPAHVKFSEAEAILTAVSLLSRAYAVLLSAPTKPETSVAMAAAVAATVSRSMAPGQAIELKSSASSDARADESQAIHANKTASLFELAARIACRCADAEGPVEDRLVAFATALGLAFQIVDDLQDVADPGEARGNLARIEGTEGAAQRAREQLEHARAAARVDPAGGLAALVDWLSAALDEAVDGARAKPAAAASAAVRGDKRP
jgi:geranylgeranyl pyrophosphate synthase